jgi:hypothetical protein
MAASKKKSVNGKPLLATRQEDHIRIRRVWPLKLDLQAWWIKYKIANATMDQLDDPEVIRQWFIEMHSLTDMGVHVELYAYCPEFRVEFACPRDYGSDSSVGIGRGR